MPRKPKPKAPPPNPGSDAALDLGCRCPVMDNAQGRGNPMYGGDFVISGDCPLHGTKAFRAPNGQYH